MVCRSPSKIISMSVQFPYRAVICGEEHIVKDWRGRKLITDKESFFVGHIYGDWQIQSNRLFEVALIQSDGNGGWLLNGKALSLLTPLPMGARLAHIPSDENLRVYKDKICAVAWFDKTGNSAKVTELLDEVISFWKSASLPPVESNEEPSLAKAFGQLAYGLHTISKYHDLFAACWSKAIWLTEFRNAAQKIPISPQQKQITSTDLSNVPVEAVEPTKNKTAKARQPKTVGRAENVVAPDKSTPEFFTSIQAAADYIGVSSRTILNWKKRGWLKVEQNVKKIRIAKTDLDKCKNRQ
jgi:hypothetical protein